MAMWQIITSVYIIILIIPGSGCEEREYRLLGYLLANYDPAVRPAINASQSLTVVLSLALHAIITVDTRVGSVVSVSRVCLGWQDAHLSWNSTDFGGISAVRVPYQRVWKPDILLINSVDAPSPLINTNVILRSSGEVRWLTQGKLTSHCTIDLTYFPFDAHTCHLVWASWSYDFAQVDLVKETGGEELSELTWYHPHPEFEVVGGRWSRSATYTPYLLPDPHTTLTYTLHLRRRPTYYVINLILPCVLLNVLAVLVFCVPCESGEKLTMVCCVLVCLTVLLTTLRDSLPPSQTTPLISIYFWWTLGLVCAAAGGSLFPLCLHHHRGSPRSVPRPLHTLLLQHLPRCLFLTSPSQPDVTENVMHNDVRAGGRVGGEQATPIHKLLPEESDHLLHPQHPPPTPSPPPPHSPPHIPQRPHISEVEGRLVEVVEAVERTIQQGEARLLHHQAQEITRRQWQQVAQVVDRLLLWCFLLASAVAAVAILLSVPHGTTPSPASP